jgi:hypothetical protein
MIINIEKNKLIAAILYASNIDCSLRKTGTNPKFISIINNLATINLSVILSEYNGITISNHFDFISFSESTLFTFLVKLYNEGLLNDNSN